VEGCLGQMLFICWAYLNTMIMGIRLQTPIMALSWTEQVGI
jgi:hypothetical protein